MKTERDQIWEVTSRKKHAVASNFIGAGLGYKWMKFD